MSFGTGARFMGMCGISAAVADSSDVIFSNPAGLGEIDSFMLSSSSGKVLDDTNYLSLNGTYPLGKLSSIGIGYAGGFISGIDIRNSAGTFLNKANYGNSVFAFGFGKKFADSFSVGASIKYYSVDSAEIASSTGRGLNVDVGLLKRGWDWISFGLVGKNILTSSQINYSNSENTPLPQELSLGTNINILGGKMHSIIISPVELNVLAQANFGLNQTKPVGLLTGIEFSPSPYLTLRTGSGADKFSAGISLNFAGIGIHYAYTTRSEFSETSGTYISISYDEKGWPLEEQTPSYFSQKS
ncbi:MAG: hypothetical protein WCV91_04140 [Candidatus Margulisiibacteriota bacterium]